MAKTKTIEMHAAIDDDGDYGVGIDADDAAKSYEENGGSISGVCGFRMVKILVTIPLPEIVTLSGTVGEYPEAVLVVE